MGTCFLFGHRNCPESLESAIYDAALQHYLSFGIREYVVGDVRYGSFNRIAQSALRSVKMQYPDIRLTLLLYYLPSRGDFALPNGFDFSTYPPLENTPKQLAIIQANQYTVRSASSLICYVRHPGNARKLLDYANSRIPSLPITNIGSL